MKLGFESSEGAVAEMKRARNPDTCEAFSNTTMAFVSMDKFYLLRPETFGAPFCLQSCIHPNQAHPHFPKPFSTEAQYGSCTDNAATSDSPPQKMDALLIEMRNLCEYSKNSTKGPDETCSDPNSCVDHAGGCQAGTKPKHMAINGNCFDFCHNGPDSGLNFILDGTCVKNQSTSTWCFEMQATQAWYSTQSFLDSK